MVLVDVPVHLFDGSGANDVSILELTVQPIDDPTVVVQNIPDAAFIENFEHEWTADLNSVFMDVDNELDFIVAEDTTVIGFNIENDILQLFSEEALNGITDMIVSAYNPEFPEVITATDTFQISVANANNYPVIEPILDVTMNEDDTLRVPLLGSDVDGDDVYFVVGFVDHVSTELVDSGDTLILIPEPDWFGEALVTVNIFDGMGASDATSFLLTVRDVDDLPVVRDYIEDITLYEDFTQPWIRDLNEVFLDIDGDLTFEAVFDDPSLLNMDLMNGILSLSSLQDINGSATMYVTASNPMRESVTDTVLVSILAVNDAPEIIQIGDISIDEDAIATISLEGSDVDGDSLYFAVEPQQNINALIEGNTLTLSPLADWNGESSITVYLLDGSGESDQSTFTLTVESIDDMPFIVNGLDDVYLNEDFKESWSVNLDDVFTDIDGDLEYAAQLVDTSIVDLDLMISTLSLSAKVDQNGETDLIITASNPMRESVSDTILVAIQAINDAPVIDAISDTIINEDQEVVIPLSGSDVDGDELTFIVEPVENFNSYISGNGTLLNLVPDENWFGETQVVVNVLDGNGLTDSTAFNVIVLSVDDDPFQEGYLADLDFNEDFTDPWSINLNEVFIDIDGELNFQLQSVILILLD